MKRTCRFEIILEEVAQSEISAKLKRNENKVKSGFFVALSSMRTIK